jgi:hypothetical protein
MREVGRNGPSNTTRSHHVGAPQKHLVQTDERETRLAEHSAIAVELFTRDDRSAVERLA